MHGFDSLTLELFVREYRGFFEGAALQKIQQPSKRELVLTFRGQGETRKFYINVQPDFAHICFKEGGWGEIPKQAPMFCMLLRKYLTGARVAAFKNVEYERILEIYFNAYDEIGSQYQLCLCIELMGKHSNVILYNAKTHIIIGCAHNISPEKSSLRELYGGIPYIYPPTKPQPFKQLDTGGVSIEEYFSRRMAESAIAKERANLEKIVQKELKKALKALTPDKKEGKAEEYKTRGENCLLNGEIGEAQKYFKLYKKEKNARKYRENLAQESLESQKYWQEVLFQVQNAMTTEELSEIKDVIAPASTGKPAKTQKITLESFERNDSIIYIGKNSKQNDYLISKLASGEDYWFHALDYPSAHVLLKRRSGSTAVQKPPTKEILEFCARLVKENSPLKDSAKAPVIYTKKKYLKKPPGAKAGYVTYSNEKEIII